MTSSKNKSGEGPKFVWGALNSGGFRFYSTPKNSRNYTYELWTDSAAAGEEKIFEAFSSYEFFEEVESGITVYISASTEFGEYRIEIKDKNEEYTQEDGSREVSSEVVKVGKPPNPYLDPEMFSEISLWGLISVRSGAVLKKYRYCIKQALKEIQYHWFFHYQ